MACSLIAGAALGAAFGELLNVVIFVIKKTTEFKPLLERLESTLNSIRPIILEVTELNEILDHNTNDEISSFLDLLEMGKTHILKSCSIQYWNVYRKYSHARKLLKLEATILIFFKIQAQDQLLSISRRTLINVRHVTRQNDRILAAVTNRLEVSDNCDVPELPGTLIGLDLQVEELKGTSPKVDDASVVVLSAPQGLQCRRFSLAEIKQATKNFNAGLVIGKGGFGEVYKGTIDNGATTVAIKRLGFWSRQGAPEFWTEIMMLSKFRHSHLVSLIGYCNDHPEMIIVYEYMSGGTLADNLHKRRSHRPLSWIQRLKVCLGAARGLDYLHTGTDIQTRVIHRDVKSTNILLDANCDAKISDFGLSKIGPAEQINTHVSTRVKGTCGYMDPEYLWSHRLTRKSDVYAFGVVMLEALCGRPAVDRNLDEEQWGLAKWAKRCIKEGRLLEIVDPHLNGSFLSDCLEAFACIADQCLHSDSRKRPTMAEVVNRLEYALSLQEASSFSLSDVEIITSGKGASASAGSAIEPDEKHASNLVQHQIPVTKKMTYAWRFFSTKDPVISANDPLISAYSCFQSPFLKRFSLAELQVATDNFSNKNIVGRGGFGKVYKGQLLDGSLVAIKRLKRGTNQGAELQFKSKIELSFMANHRSLLRLRGFCATESPSTERLLVYPYMANGTVASVLRDRTEAQSALDWNTRKRIALEAARGLAYLHDDCIPGIIHRNVKAANLFLNEDFNTHIGGFGLAKLMEQECTHVTTAVRGTIGHIAPEYMSTGKCSLKTDVFGYGIMLQELITAKMAFDLARLAYDDGVMLLNWIKGLLKEKKLDKVIDTDLRGYDIYEEIEQLIKVAILCTQHSPAKRPSMSQVVRLLEGTDGLAERWDEWQKEEEEEEEEGILSIPISQFKNMPSQELV